MNSETQDRLAQDRERFEVERLEKELAGEKRIKARRRSHAVAGAVTLMFFLVFTDLLFEGFGAALNPVRLLINVILALLFGLPTGYVISVRGGGLWGGAITAAGVFLVIGFIVGLPTMFWGRSLTGVVGSAVVLAILGIIPGAFIGLHVDSDP